MAKKRLHDETCQCVECTNRELRWRLANASEALQAAHRAIEVVSTVLKERGEEMLSSWGLTNKRKRNTAISQETRDKARERMKTLWAEGKMGRPKKNK